MQCRKQLEQYLRTHQIPFQIQHHPVAFTAQEIAKSEHIPGKIVAKVVIAFSGKKMIMLVLSSTLWIDFERLQADLREEEVYLAQEQEFEGAFPGCAVGAMPPFGNLYGLSVYVDRDLKAQETIVFPIGTHTDTMSLKYTDFERLVHPTVMKFAYMPPPFTEVWPAD